MNIPATPPPQQVAVVLPTDPMQLMILAKDLANARLIPSHFQKSPADVWLVLSFCRSRGLDFFMVVGECSVVKGRLFFSGKLTAALLNTSGYLVDRLSYEYSGEGEDRKVTVRGKIKGEVEQRIVEVFVEEVKTANEHWVKSPDQMLAYSGARIWGRRHMPEVLMGLMFEGEAEMIDVTPGADTSIRHMPQLTKDSLPPKAEPAERVVDEVVEKDPEPTEEEEIIPHNIAVLNGDWSAWCNELYGYVRNAPDAMTIDRWTTENFDNLTKLQKADATKATELVKRINHQISIRNEKRE